MRAGATLSLLLHLAILLMILIGLPDLFKPEEVIEPVAVQLATVADLTAQPQPAVKPLPTPVLKPATPPPPAPAAPQAPSPPPLPAQPQPAEQTPPPPQQPPQPTQPTIAEPPQPIIIPDQSKPPPQQQQAQIEPPPVPELRPKVPPDQTKPKVKPQPQQTADFNSLLKNVEKLNTQSADNTAQQQTPQPPQPPQPQTDQLGAQLSSSELDAVRSQIAGCWYLDPGKKGADTLVVEIHVDLGSDGTVLGNPEILDATRAATDPVFQAAAEAARRALLKCSPLHLPPDKYDTWKSTTFRFNPSGMLG